MTLIKMKKLPRLLKFSSLSSWCFFIGFALLAFYFSSPVRAQLLQVENQCILQGGGAGCAPGVTGQGFDDKAFNLNQLGGTVDNLNYFLIGASLAHPEIANLNGGGAVADMGRLIGKLYQPPASSFEYFAYVKQNLGLSSPAYAQGTGYQGLRPLIPIWTRFRDAAYMVYILLFVITGLLIMFRVRISPQAVVTIQNSLPRLLILLILITLSYAIAGLMIDLMYVVLFLIFNLFSPTLARVTPPIIPKDMLGNNIITVFWGIPGGGWAIINNSGETVAKIVDEVTGGIKGFSGFLGALTGGVAWLIFAVAVLFALFRLFFVLLKAYIWILVMVIFGPLMLLTAALPGSKGISGWVRGLLANLAVFPAAITMFLLAAAITNQPGGPVWVAPYLGGAGATGLQALIGLGIILLTPTVAQMMNDAIKPPPFPYGAAVGQAIGAGPAMAGGVGRRVGAMAPYKPTGINWWRGFT